MKRLLDLLLSLIALALLSPLLIAAAVAVKLGSPGPIFFKQIRVGRHTRTFGMYKFRTMVANAASIGPYFTNSGDPRITPAGRWLRKTSVDELPQLLNVLLGQMSLVGPRPDVPAQKPLYTPQQWQRRHQVRPGITGLAQAKIRSEGTPEQRTALDLQYVAEHSLWLDVRIMWWTLARLGGSGAN